MIVWLASYPRSGNTLVRTILHRSFGLVTHSKYNDETDIGADPRLAAQVGHERFEGAWPEVYARFLSSSQLHLVKTHDAPEDTAPAIVVVRHGWTATVSNQHYLQDFSGIKASLVEVITGQVGHFPSWGRFLDLWDPENRPNTLILKYEDLLADPAGQIKRMAVFLKLKTTAEWKNNFTELQKLDPRFFRQGRAKITKSEFGADNANLFEQVHGDWMARLGYSPGKGKTATESSRLLREVIARNQAIVDQGWNESQRHIDTLQAQLDQTVGENQKNIDQLRTQLDRLATTSRQQEIYIATLMLDRDRLGTVAATAEIESKRAAGDSQKYIDALRAQLDQLAATSRQQDTYIATLVQDRDRLGAVVANTEIESKRAASEGQKHIDALRVQLDQLAVTSRQQDDYIATLKREVERLDHTAAQLSAAGAHHEKVINEQTVYIGLLEKQRAAHAPNPGP